MQNYWNRVCKQKQLYAPVNRPFSSSRGPLCQNEVKCLAFDMEMILHSHANKTHLNKKGWGRESEGFWNSEVAYYRGFRETGPRGPQTVRSFSMMQDSR